MGSYVTRSLNDSEYKDIITTIRAGYMDHKPNEQIATILILEANLGCRIGDIMDMTTDSIIKDGDYWKLNIIEQKTGKKRSFIVSDKVKALIDKWTHNNGISAHEKLFDITSPAVWKALRQVTDYLGLDNISSHSFRKYAGERLYSASGHDIELVREFFNHSSVKTTQIYLRRTSAQMDSALNKIVSLA